MLATCRFLQTSSRLTCYCRRLAERRLILQQWGALHTGPARLRSAEASTLTPPAVEGEEKQYSPRIQKIVEDISSLTLLEVADLNELLKKTLKIQDVPIMAAGAMAASAAPAKAEEEEEAMPVQQKMTFSVKMTKFAADKKVQLIKEIKNLIPGMNLVQAKKFVESVPQVVKADLPKEEAEKMRDALVAAGADIELD